MIQKMGLFGWSKTGGQTLPSPTLPGRGPGPVRSVGRPDEGGAAEQGSAWLGRGPKGDLGLATHAWADLWTRLELANPWGKGGLGVPWSGTNGRYPSPPTI